MEEPRTAHSAVNQGGYRAWSIFAVLQFDDIFSSRTFGPADDVKFNTFAFFKRFEALPLDGGMMDKNILAAILLDKAESLGIIKPFYRSFCHFRSSLCHVT